MATTRFKVGDKVYIPESTLYFTVPETAPSRYGVVQKVEGTGNDVVYWLSFDDRSVLIWFKDNEVREVPVKNENINAGGSEYLKIIDELLKYYPAADPAELLDKIEVLRNADTG